MDTLLDQVIANTIQSDHLNNPIHITNEDQLLDVVDLIEVKDEPTVKRNAKDEFVRTLFRELFREARFFYRQYKAIKDHHLSKEQVELVYNRLGIILDAMAESYPEFKIYLLEKVRSNENDETETANFILESLKTDDPGNFRT